MPDLDRLIKTVVDSDASDLILKTGSQPAMKQGGKVLFLSEEKICPERARAMLLQMARPEIVDHFDRHGEADFAYEHPGKGRFRANVFRQSGEISFVLRPIKQMVPSFDDLHVPRRPFDSFVELERGLVIVTGVTGSGKSTSLASIIDAVNNTKNRHVVTLEDPIEFRFTDNLSVINQREIGTDTASWLTGLKNAMREAPDVIMIGEIRDHLTMEAAIAAAETGHLVLTTLHTLNAVQTVERILTFYPPHQHSLVRFQLSTVLKGVASQRLIRCMTSARMVPAVEVLLGTPRVAEILKTGATSDLERALVEGHEYYGTQTFNMSLRKLHEEGMISLDDAFAASDNPDDLRLALRGITRGSDASMRDRMVGGARPLTRDRPRAK